MTVGVERMHWLNVRDDVALLTLAVCGDWLSPPGHDRTWFAPTRVSRGDRVLLFCYEAGQSSFGLCAVLPRDITADWVMRLRERLSPHGAEERWTYFVGHLGRFHSVATAAAPIWTESEIENGRQKWRGRRARHPSALIDRLLARDRMEAEQSLKTMLKEQVVRVSSSEMGDIPHAVQRAKMGDKSAE
jgi:hypothetical protein